jgi:hypothetical protein
MVRSVRCLILFAFFMLSRLDDAVGEGDYPALVVNVG